MDFKETYGFTEEEWETCLRVLASLKDQPLHNPDNRVFSGLIAKISKTAKKQRSQENREDLASILQGSVIAKTALDGQSLYGEEHRDEEHHFTRISRPRNCYACNSSYQDIHSFYHRMCPDCAQQNLEHRWRSMDLNGRKAILTGGRVKVGFATALKLLRANTHVTVTTRFPALALEAFQKEKDYAQWANRLQLYGLDLRMLQDVEAFISYYTKQHNSLDILINNAAQTIQYDERYYTPILQKERHLLEQYAKEPALLLANERMPTAKAIGSLKDLKGLELNRFGQPVDLRSKTSWNATLQEIDAFELMEVNLINQISPFLLIKAFTPLFRQSAFAARYIVNVTSSEGQFSYTNKTMFHPHTNMTKAALNMLTLTSAKEYVKEGIYMNSVDVGWISTGAREELRERQFEEGYIPPLDSVDGAARILHPIYEQLAGGEAFYGQLLKNYQVEQW